MTFPQSPLPLAAGSPSSNLILVHVQADEIRVKGHKMIVWMGLAMMVSMRLWLAGMEPLVVILS